VDEEAMLSQTGRRVRLLPAIAAVAGPLLVWALAWVGIWSYQDDESRQALENAGRVVNGTVFPRGVVGQIGRMLERHQPEVLLLGPSYANTDVQPDLLAKRLGIDPEKVVLLSIPNSVGAHWYSILKYRVFDSGYQPKVVVVVSGLQSMLLATPLTESSYLNLAVHLDPERPDPVVEDKVVERVDVWWANVREQRGKVRTAFFDSLRLAPLGLFRSAARPNRRLGVAEARSMLEAVFDDAQINMSLHGHSTPVVEADRGMRYYDPAMLPRPERSFIPDITALVSAAESHIVWVRPPMSPHIPAHLDDVVLPGVQDEVAAMVEAEGGKYLDMRELPMSATMFKNEDHMNEEGSRRFTEALAAAVREMAAIPDELRTEIPPFKPASVTWLGEQPPLPEALTTWGGVGRWVAPGTTLRFAFGKAWDVRRGPMHVEVVLEHPGEAAGVVVSVDGVALPLVRSAAGGVTQRSFGSGLPERPTDAWNLDVVVPAEAGWVRLGGLALGVDEARTVLGGDPTSFAGLEVDLFAVSRGPGGRLIDRSVHPTYTNPPGKVPGAKRALLEVPGAMAAFDTHRWSFLSDEQLMGQTNFGSRCSPLRVLENGRPLPLANVSCLEVKRQLAGRSCHMADAIYFASSDGTDPNDNGRIYTLGLDRGRRCDGAAWLYPKGEFVVAWPAERLATLEQPARRFSLSGRYLQQRKANLRIKLVVDGEVRIEESVDGRRLRDGALHWTLEPPVPTTAKVELTVANREHVFYLIDHALLAEQPPLLPR
jgi:hypothetical protein